MIHPVALRTSCRGLPLKGRHLRPGEAGSAVSAGRRCDWCKASSLLYTFIDLSRS